MEWRIKVAHDWEEFLWDRYEETGELAAVLMEKPFLEDHQEQLLQAFYLLMPDRPLGMGCVGSIPTIAIFAMASEIGEDRMDFLALCRELDAVYQASANRTA